MPDHKSGAVHSRGVWLGLGVALSTATQLRPGIALGPGEVLLAGWVAASLASMFWKGRLEVSAEVRVLAMFWAASLVLLLTGLLVGMLIGLSAREPYHDLLAYCLVAALMLVALAKPGGEEEVRRAALVAMGVSTVALAALLAATFPGRDLGPLQVWSGGVRFMGWSNNPNQVSLAMCAVPFLALHAWGGVRRGWRRVALGLVLVLSMAVGVATLSDSLVVAWGSCWVLLAGWSWIRGLLRSGVPFARGAAFYVIAPAALLGGLLLSGSLLYQKLVDTAADIYGESGQGDLRLLLWRHGIQAMEASPFVGLGPGPHSGIDGPFKNFEAHNSYIDWGTGTGLLGVLLLGGVLAWAVVRASRSAPLLAAVVSLALVSAFGHSLRHPTFWFYIAYVVVVGRVAGSAAPDTTARTRPAGEPNTPPPSQAPHGAAVPA